MHTHVENKTTWESEELLAFIQGACAATSETACAATSETMVERVEFRIFRINPKRKANLLRYDHTPPILSAERRGSRLVVRLPSPLGYVADSPLGKLAMAAEERLHMPERDRRELFLTICDALKRNYDDAIENTKRRYTFRGVVPILTTKSTGVRATRKKTVEELEDLSRDVRYKRRDAERRLERLEARIDRLSRMESKLELRVSKAREREQKKRAGLNDQLDEELKKLRKAQTE